MLLRTLLLCLISMNAQAQLYRCEAASGEYQYTDQPCTAAGATYIPKAVMTNYKNIASPTQHNKASSSNNPIAKNQCPFISSTELRNLRIKNQYKKGLTKASIEKRLGKANSKNDKRWVYNGDYVKRTFYFKHGCLARWQEKWKGNESQITKFRDER